MCRLLRIASPTGPSRFTFPQRRLAAPWPSFRVPRHTFDESAEPAATPAEHEHRCACATVQSKQ
jgi:hypothetical protein